MDKNNRTIYGVFNRSTGEAIASNKNFTSVKVWQRPSFIEMLDLGRSGIENSSLSLSEKIFRYDQETHVIEYKQSKYKGEGFPFSIIDSYKEVNRLN